MINKILFISAEYSSHNCGGAGVYAYELTKFLSKKKIYVHVLTSGKKKTIKKINDFLTVEDIPTLFLPALRTPLFWFNTKRAVNRIIKEKHIDLIHSNANAGALIETSKPFLMTIQHPAKADDNNYFFVQRLLNKLDVFFEKKLAQKVKGIIATSNPSQHLIKEIYPENADKVRLIPIGVDTTFYQPIKGSKEDIYFKHKIKKNSTLLFYPGGMRGKRKGLEIFLDSLNSVEKVNFVCLISGNPRELGWNDYIERIIQKNKYKDNIILCGELEYNDLPKYYSAADLTIFPSLFEGFGLPVIESLACGTPVIATDTGEANHSIINNVNGILIRPKNSDEISLALNKLMTDKNLLTNLASHARSSILNKYSWEKITKEYITYYEMITN